MLVLHIVIVSIVIFLSAQFISMSIFDVDSLISDDPFTSIQKNLFQNADALKYMPIQLQKGIIDNEMVSAQDKQVQDASGSSNTDTAQVAPVSDNTDGSVLGVTDSKIVEGTVPSEEATSEPSLSATRG